jgi:hypothetical protein
MSNRRKNREFRTFNLGALLIAPVLLEISLGFAVSFISSFLAPNMSRGDGGEFGVLGFFNFGVQHRWTSG